MLSEQQDQTLSRLHHVRMVIVMKWAGTAALVAVIFAIAVFLVIRIIGQALINVSVVTRNVEWGGVFNLSIFTILLAVAISIVLHSVASSRRKIAG